MRFSDFKDIVVEQKTIVESSEEGQEAKELLHRASNPSVIAAAVKFLRKLVDKNQVTDQEPAQAQQPKPTQEPAEPEQEPEQEPAQAQQPVRAESTEFTKSQILEDAQSMKREALSLIDQVEDEEQLNALLSFLRKNDIFELCHAAIEANISQGVKEDLDKKLGQMIMDLNAPFEEKEEFLKQLATGEGYWDGEDLIRNLKGNVYQKMSGNSVASALAKPIALQLRGKMGYGPDQGPGEFLLAFTGAGIDLAEKSDLVLISGKGVEVKADGTAVNPNTGKKSRSGGRLYATSGYNGGTGARSLVRSTLIEAGVPEEALDEFGWNGKTKGKKYNNLNFNKAGIANMNQLLAEYTEGGAAERILAAIARGFYTDLPSGMESDFVKNSSKNNQIDYATAIKEFVALGHEYYKHQEGHDYIMIFNTDNGDYVMIKDGGDMKALIDEGALKISGGMDYFDDRSKGTPQILTGSV